MLEEETNLSSAKIAASLEDDLKANQQESLLYHSYLLLQRGHQLQTQTSLEKENPFLIALNLADVVLNNSRFISLPESIQLKIQQAFTLYLELAITQFLNLLTTSKTDDLIKFVSAIKNAVTGEFGAVFAYLSELYSQLSAMWYAEVYLIRKLASLIIAHADEKATLKLLIELQTLLSTTVTSDWHIAYAAVEALSSIVKYSKFSTVQQRAWCGEPCGSGETGYFHLLSYQDFHVKQGSETSWRVRYIAGCAYAQLCEHETPAIKEEAHNALNA